MAWGQVQNEIKDELQLREYIKELHRLITV